MTSVQEAIAEAARGLVGVRFRPQGRDPATGLDCVGVALAALARAGRPVAAPRDYPQRGGGGMRNAAMIDAAGLARIEPAAAGAGDILMIDAGAAQVHLAIRTGSGFVHADAALRRIVETPGAPARPVIAAWRAEGEG